jgi:Ca2+/Na+ antiporter
MKNNKFWIFTRNNILWILICIIIITFVLCILIGVNDEKILAYANIFTLVALVVYVFFTAKMAKASKEAAEEMKATRLYYSAPNIIVYFDFDNYGHFYLVIKNMGHASAKNISVNFNPTLGNSFGEGEADYSIVSNTITLIPPGSELRTFFDTAFSMFSDDSRARLDYEVSISYHDVAGNDYQRVDRIDLNVYRGISWIREKNVSDLSSALKEHEKYLASISKALTKSADHIERGFWIRNPEFLITSFIETPETWYQVLLSKLSQARVLWKVLYEENPEKLIHPNPSELRNRYALLGSQILILASNSPDVIPHNFVQGTYELSEVLTKISMLYHWIGGRPSSVDQLEELGTKAIDIIQKLKEEIHI